MDGWMDGWMDGLDGLMNWIALDCIDSGWIWIGLEIGLDEWVDGWIDWWMNILVDGWMHRWMESSLLRLVQCSWLCLVVSVRMVNWVHDSFENLVHVPLIWLDFVALACCVDVILFTFLHMQRYPKWVPKYREIAPRDPKVERKGCSVSPKLP